ncbi:pyridoxamine 5'-phosphate oxidase [Leucobacter viscericola]|uniref:Pyridoxamine 5'-phosphate oxidase n=1 Tax=Leucobacter viscericola TaxID=2714935 RepID=A0A6G7XE71_9MICO|nr:pyridoxamine 5'-phosphate oxidase family protein [Leucobacter viscericola]QIK62910.1 pyridoxamine 5'-phosphate oxidase [Leucobacter viscericola]
MSELESRLRQLPAFPEPLPVLREEDLPASPDELFLEWLNAAIESGARQPHAMTMLTTRPDGTPVGRTLILKDIDAEGYHFSTHRSSRKGVEIAHNPRISFVFFWRESGRQVRVTGDAVALSDEVSQADWAERPSYEGAPNPDWQRYALWPDEFEFMQARLDRNHTRIEYLRDGHTWTMARVTTPAG